MAEYGKVFISWEHQWKASDLQHSWHSFIFFPASLAGTAEDAEDKEKEKLKFGFQIKELLIDTTMKLVQSEKKLPAINHQLQTNTWIIFLNWPWWWIIYRLSIWDVPVCISFSFFSFPNTCSSKSTCSKSCRYDATGLRKGLEGAIMTSKPNIKRRSQDSESSTATFTSFLFAEIEPLQRLHMIWHQELCKIMTARSLYITRPGILRWDNVAGLEAADGGHKWSMLNFFRKIWCNMSLVLFI